MPRKPDLITRRKFLATSAALGAGFQLASAASPGQPRPKVAAVFTELRFRSHPYNILENFLAPYYFRGQLTDPGVDVVSFYADQFPPTDMAREVSSRFGIPLFPSIDQALCRGGKELAVDAVLTVGEHGEYPYNARGQHLYPRKEFFDQALAVMKRSNRFVPYFNDKHLTYRWDWAREMYDTARKAGMPLLAGSSVPLAQRIPALEIPSGAEIEEALVIHGGGLEVYGFHGLELLQSMVESRKGGETGIAQVEVLTGEAYERASRSGRWPADLAEAAMTAERAMNVRRQRRPPELPPSEPGTTSAVKKSNDAPPPPKPEGPHAILVTYRSGLKGTVLRLDGNGDRWNFACRLRGESQSRATAFYNGPWGNRTLFKALSHAIQHLFVQRSEPYPAERTLLTTGAIEAAMLSHEKKGPIETPHLDITYNTRDWSSFREDGASWRIVTADTPQPVKFLPEKGAR
jgi:hypothetical protein